MTLIDKFLSRKALGHFWNHIVTRMNKHTENTDNPHKVTLEQLGYSATDYEQNDSSAPDYIKNRPFYGNHALILDNKTYSNEQWGVGVNVDFDLEEGKEHSL